MERKHNNFWIVVLILLLGLIAFSGKTETPNQTIQVPETQDSGTTQIVKDYPDWTLIIPEIDFTQQMTKITRQGSTLPVPDRQPGYYSENSYNLFIVGHNHSVFSRLPELPKEIQVYRRAIATSHQLKDYKTLPVENIDMAELLNYHGVVIMTCAGQEINGHYMHRLILYYQ